MTGIEEVAPRWGRIALVCRKCSRKLDGGFGRKGRTSLVKALRAELKLTSKRRELRVIEVDCLGLCPKRGVTVVAGSGRVFVAREGCDPAELLQMLTPSLAAVTVPMTEVCTNPISRADVIQKPD